MKTSKLFFALALAFSGTASAFAAQQITLGGGLVAGRVDGVAIEQTPHGLDGGAGARTGGYTGLQASAGVVNGPVVIGFNVMKSAGGVHIDDLSASAGYTFTPSGALSLTPGVQMGVQHVDGQAYTRRAITLGAVYTFTPEWSALASVAAGRVHGTRVGPGFVRGDGDYRAAQVGVIYSPPKVGTFTLAACVQGTQTLGDLPGLGDQSMRNRALSLTYSRTF